MKKIFLLFLTLISVQIMANAQNPFFEEFATVHHTPPFSRIDNSSYMEAIDRGISLANQEIDAITANRATPDFENTIVALERVGRDLNRVLNVMYPLLSADSNDELMELSLEADAKLSEYSTNLILNEALWNKVKQVYDRRDEFNLDAEDRMLLKKTYESFALNGAELKGADRDEFRRLNARLSELTNKFGQNVLKELNTYEIWLTADSTSQACLKVRWKPRHSQPAKKVATANICSHSHSPSTPRF